MSAVSPLRYQLKRPVFFVGFMGAGKTSVARRLARDCGVASVDMDTYLERREGKTVKEIFDEGGESLFRTIETNVLKEITTKPPMLISCGGGVVTREENRAILKEAGFVIFLKITVEEAAARIHNKESRPLFNNLESARQRNKERLPLYEEVADVVINTAGKSTPKIAFEIQRLLEKEGLLCPQQR